MNTATIDTATLARIANLSAFTLTGRSVRDLPTGLSYDPRYLARLAKLTREGSGPDERSIPFRLSAINATLRAVGDGYDVLICPTRGE